MPKVNTLRQKPNFTLHRHKTGAPVVADDTALADFRADNPRADIDCAGWDSVRGFVKLTGGTSINIQATELVKYMDSAGVDQEELVEVGSAITGLVDGDTFDITVNQARLLVKITVVTGGVTAVDVFLAGAQANDIEHRGGARRY